MRMVMSIGVIGLIACTEEKTGNSLNTAPEIGAISIVPTEGVTTFSELRCVATAIDEDNDILSLTYQWTNGNGDILGESGTLLLTPELVVPTEELTCTAMVSDTLEFVTMSTSVVVENTAPTISSVSITPQSVRVDSLLECTVDSEDADLEELSVSYIWTQNGTEVGTESTLQLDPINYSDDDVIVCTVTVEDGYEGTASESAEVVIGNTAPEIGSVLIVPDPASSIDDLTCVPSDIIDLEGHNVALAYAWTIDEVNSNEASDTLAGPFAVGSTISCSIIPNDGLVDGTPVLAETTIVNTAPVVDSVSLDSGPIYTDGTVTAMASLSDIDAEQSVSATYTWHVLDASAGGTDVEVQTGADNTLDGSLFDKDDQVYVVVTPNDGLEEGSSFTSTSLSIANSEPIGLTASVTSSNSFYNDSTLTCLATASDIDPEDASLTYSYAWSTGDTGADLVLGGTIMPGTALTCTATATDGSGASISVDSVETLINRASTVDSVTLPQDVTTETTSVFCDASASDLDGETPTVTYAWTVAGVTNPEVSDTLTVPFVFGETIECTVTSTDAMGTGSSMSATTSVLNTAPVVDSVLLPSGDVTTDGSITAVVSMSDVDSAHQSALTATFEWFVNGSSVQSGMSDTLDGAHFQKGNDVYVVVTANDGFDDSATVTSLPITIVNYAPTNLQVSIVSSDSFYNDSTLTCTATASDLDVNDGVDTLTYDYSWSTGATGDTLDLAGSVMPGVEVTCSVSVSDGIDSISSDGMETIVNRLPTLDAISLPQDATAETTSLFCDVTASDLDGETPTVSYVWAVDGNPESETGDTLTRSFSYAEVVTCEATPMDAIASGVTETATTTILNTSPIVSNVVLGPDPAYADSSFSVTSVLNDVDVGQSGSLSVSYQWYVDGQPVGSDVSTFVNGTVNEFFAKGQEVYVVITPNDGVENGTSVQSNAVVVSNSSPVMTSVTVTPDPATVGADDLTCDVTATDADGDSILYTYEWSDSTGIQQTMTDVSDTSDTFLAAGLTPDTWSCDVTPFDGTNYGNVLSGSTTVESGCNSIQFTDTSASITVSNGGFGVGGGDWTFEYWVRIDDNFTGGNYLFVQNENYSSYAFRAPYNESTGIARCYTYRNTSGSHNLDNGYSDPINDGNWHHIACNYSSGTLRVYTDGNLSSVDSGSPILNEQSNMSIGNASGYSGYKAPSATLGGIRISSVARYPSEFTPETSWNVDSNTIAQYLTESEFDGSTLVDEAGGDNNGAHRQGVVALNSCPDEDLDGDGYAAWEDCDDSDPSVPSVTDTDCNGIADVFGTCDGSETFSVQSVASGREVQGGIIADVDGDGYEDALFNEQLDNKLQIYWGDGTGSFSSSNRTSLSIGRSGGPGAVGDFDNDGDNDIVWGLQDSSTMKRIFNNGNRSFSIQSSSESQGPRNMELIDVNGDGNLDVYIYKRFGSCVARKLGNGDGTFGSTSCVTSSRVAFDVSDIDNDGSVEMVYSESGTLQMAQLDSNGLIQSSTSMGIPSTGWPRFYDIDADGFDDLFVYNNGEIIQYINDGSGSFSECSLIDGLSRSFADVGDLNNDGFMDYIRFETCGYCNSTNYFHIQQ